MTEPADDPHAESVQTTGDFGGDLGRAHAAYGQGEEALGPEGVGPEYARNLPW
ncbi:hypothetical protein ACFV1N_45695 [Streptosporangium canum]|uniref:hypothetical protein n=1 Tax=Streptosporangium canum TaxID=324952 RepID=UPI003673E0F4